MKHWILQYVPHLNQQTIAVIYVILALAAMALAGGAPVGSGGAGV